MFVREYRQTTVLSTLGAALLYSTHINGLLHAVLFLPDWITAAGHAINIYREVSTGGSVDVTNKIAAISNPSSGVWNQLYPRHIINLTTGAAGSSGGLARASVNGRVFCAVATSSGLAAKEFTVVYHMV